MTCPTVTRLASRAPRLVRFSAAARPAPAGQDPAVEHGAQVRVARAQLTGQVVQVGGEGADVGARGALGVQHRLAVLDQPRGLGQGLRGRLGERVPGVDEALQVGAAAGEGPPSSSTVVLRSSFGTDWTSRFTSSSTVSIRVGVRVSVRAIRSRAQVGPRSVRGCRSTYCSPTAERFSTTARVSRGTATAVHPQVDEDAAVGQPQPVDLADAHAAVGDLGTGEDAAGVGEVGGDDVPPPTTLSNSPT